MRELVADLPIGIEVHRVSWQSDEVSAAVNGFLVSLGQAVAIVLLVITIPIVVVCCCCMKKKEVAPSA